MEKMTDEGREQFTATLQQIRVLHQELTRVKSRGKSPLLPILIGFGAGLAACALVAVPLVFILNPASSDPSTQKSAVPGLAGCLVMPLVWILTAFLLQRRAKKQSAIRLPGARQALEAAVEQAGAQFPEWVAHSGGRDALLDTLRTDALVASFARTKGLVHSLLGADVQAARLAADELGRSGDPGALEALISVLNSGTDERLRASAAAALGSFDEPRSVQALKAAKRAQAQTQVGESVSVSLAKLVCRGQHTFTGKDCQCDVCGLVVHDAEQCVCRRCGQETHTYIDCVCTRCFHSRHDWRRTRSGEMQCANCNRVLRASTSESDGDRDARSSTGVA